MSLTRFRSYNPGEKPYSRRRTEEEWEPYQLLLSEMHAQRYTRKDMLVKLREVGFDVSPGQLLSQMKKWDMMVYGERASHSGTCPQIMDESTSPRASEPLISGLGHDDALPQSEEKPSLSDLPLLPPLSFGGSLSHTRQFSGHSFDDISDTISFSTLDDIEDISVDRTLVKDPENSQSPQIYHGRKRTFSEPVIHGLGSDVADPASILRQISTITEAWCGNFPTTCCCHALFRGQGSFKSSPELYKIILEQSSPRSLKYIVALLNLMETKFPGQDKQELRVHFWDTVNYYLQLCTRFDLKNKLAPRILHRLLEVWEAFSDGDRLPFPTSDLFRLSVVDSHESLIDRILKTKAPSNLQRCPPDYQVDWHIDAERDVGCVVGFSVRQPSTSSLLNSAGEVFGSTKSWNRLDKGPDTQRSLTELVSTANQIAARMQFKWSDGSCIATAYDLGDCDVPLIFTALGLMIALETTSFTSEVDLSNPESWTPGLQTFIETTVDTLSLNADYADKFRKAYWLVRCETIGYGGKTVHMGEPCIATHAWEVLERNIHDYDEARTWFERRFFSGRKDTWPQANDLMTGADDNMSMRSEHSYNSFRKFQALALHLKIGTPASGSLKTKSSSRKSRRSDISHMSWQLERVLQIRNPDAGEEAEDGDTKDAGVDVTSVAERAQMDEMAYKDMLAVVE